LKIPPPEERLCVKHGRPITPSAWKKGCRISECAKCIKVRTHSPEAQERRAKKWDDGDIRCINHPERRCKRSDYVYNWRRACSSCCDRKANGDRSSKYKRGLRKRNYTISARLRERGLAHGNALRGLRLFERSTGFKLGA
jgi:hypothetical protein